MTQLLELTCGSIHKMVHVNGIRLGRSKVGDSTVAYNSRCEYRHVFQIVPLFSASPVRR